MDYYRIHGRRKYEQRQYLERLSRGKVTDREREAQNREDRRTMDQIESDQKKRMEDGARENERLLDEAKEEIAPGVRKALQESGFMQKHF